MWRGPADRCSTGNRDRDWQLREIAFRAKTAVELEHRVHRADGTLGWVYSRAVPIMNECGGASSVSLRAVTSLAVPSHSLTSPHSFMIGTAREYTLNECGEVREWLGTASDVTARKLTEEALRESEKRFRAVANLGPDFLWSSDTRG
jgi:PAS domain-containing protein